MFIKEKIEIMQKEALKGNEEVMEFIYQATAYTSLSRMINKPNLQASNEDIKFYNEKLKEYIFDEKLREKLTIK